MLKFQWLNTMKACFSLNVWCRLGIFPPSSDSQIQALSICHCHPPSLERYARHRSGIVISTHILLSRTQLVGLITLQRQSGNTDCPSAQEEEMAQRTHGTTATNHEVKHGTFRRGSIMQPLKACSRTMCNERWTFLQHDGKLKGSHDINRDSVLSQ